MGLEVRFTIPGQVEEVISLNQSRMMIGTLLSNHIVMRATGVEPIHAMFEELDDGKWVITDLGSGGGIKRNGQDVEVEEEIKAGDTVVIADIEITVATELGADAVIPPPPGAELSGLIGGTAATEHAASTARTQMSNSPTSMAGTELPATEHPQTEQDLTEQPANTAVPESSGPSTNPNPDTVQQVPDSKEGRKDQLFSPRHARPSGDFLECVAYWDDTVLDVELFSDKSDGFKEVTIGDEKGAHFIAGGKKQMQTHTLARFREKDGYRVRLTKDMSARVRKDGKVTKVDGPKKISLGRRDLVHVTHGAVKYFLLFVRPPTLNLPKKGPGDPLFMSLMAAAFLIYIGVVPALWLSDPHAEKEETEEFWEVVRLPEKEKKPEKIVKPKIKKEKVKKKLAAVKKKPKRKKKPPKVKPKKVVVAKKPVQKPKIKQPKPVKNPVKKSNNISALKNKNVGVKKSNTSKKNVNLSKLKNGGMARASKRPNFKLVGPKSNNKNKLTGGMRGQGNRKAGGARKGRSKISVKGVEGPKNKKASGVNLKKLGIGSGLSIDKNGAGAIRGFKSTVGGAGGGSGSAARTSGLGGPGTRGSIGLSGSGGVGNFGGGTGGRGGGQGGSGGLGGSGLGQGFGRGSGNGSGGRGRPQITMPAGGPVSSGGLTDQEISAVIRTNLNQIRHCYERLLQRSPNSAGKVKTKFIIGTSGRVTSASVVGGNINDPVMKSCVAGKIKRWPFPKPRGNKPVTVTYPFVFSPN